MSKTEIEQEIQDIVSPHFTVKSVTNVNHNPHPFMIGAKHVVHAADKFGGMLGGAAIESAEKAGIYCAQENCRLPYNQHKSDKVCFLQLTDNLTSEVATATLKKTEDVFKRENIDGVSLVETEEKFRIIYGEETES